MLRLSLSSLSPGGAGNILIPPSDRARKIGDYLRVGIGLHFGLAIFLMIGGRYIDGVFDLLGAVIGYMGIRNRDGYSFQCVLSYTVFTGMDIFWALLRLILYFSGASATDSGSTNGWQYYCYVIGLIVSPFIYTFCCVASYYLYKCLKEIVDATQGALNGDDVMGGGGGGYAVHRDEPSDSEAGGSSWRHQESHPAPSGFKAFSGTGNRLGGN